MESEDRRVAHTKMEELMLKMYSELENKEIEENKKILLREDVVSYEERNKVDKKFGLLFEPFLFADTFGFTVYTGSITEREVLEIYNRLKYELDITFDFHTNNLYYETNDYGEGGKHFFRGYAIDIASTLHKDYSVKIKRISSH